MNPKVSIIIPVYNGADNLRMHLGNILSQTLREIEIIIVNDASTDDTLKVATDAATQFPDIVRVVDSEKNNGAGGARNLGLQIATGEYVGFVDCDDVIETSMYEKLYAAAKAYSTTGADMADSGYYYQMTDTAIVHTADDMTGEMTIEKRLAHIVAGGYIVSKIFRRDYLEKAFNVDKNLSETDLGSTNYFRRNCILEDADFLGIVFSTMANCVNVKEVLYYYLDADNSSSKTTNPVKYLANIEAAVEAIYDRVSVLPDYERLAEAFEYEYTAMLVNGLIMILTDEQNDKLLDTKIEIKKLIEIKNRVISKDITQNKYTIAKIDRQDIELFISQIPV